MKVLILASTLMLAAGCSAGGPHPREAGSAPDRAPGVGDMAPPLDFTPLDPALPRESLTWERLRGRVVVLDFWATWCAPCVASIPHLNALAGELADEPVTFVSITSEPEPTIRSFLERYPLRTVVGIDGDLSMFESFAAWAIPMTVVVDPQGRVAAVTHPALLDAGLVRDVLAGRSPAAEEHDG